MSNACLYHCVAEMYQMLSECVYCSDNEHMGQFSLRQVRHAKNRISARPNQVENTVKIETIFFLLNSAGVDMCNNLV